ncbi:HCP-like protein [Rhizoclosmatium globosum]|uniref:HCP-like protein n=1 Tax=Rhizoclosmatium globosum TaxID=329046 RepID=A0A1Y2BUL1_9FUNG|nr:HCP-like protein [Rhizoclosmatium globosum]|eukprot:ORY38441.1 HCP-like protein [Rhizoclosmatium globosum]
MRSAMHNAYVSLTDSRMNALATQLGGQCCYELGIQHSTVASATDTVNDIMAAYWFSFAAELGHAAAYSPLASMLLEGRGITRSLVNAEKWFRLASQVDAHHCFILGEAFLMERNGVVCDYDKAFHWLKRAAESVTGSDVDGCLSLSQSTTAKLELGKLYLNGRGTPINYVEADRWLCQVENEVDACTSYTMGYAFISTGTNQNYEKAFLWLKRAVAHESGLSSDQLNIAKRELGKLYLHGNGTSKDILEADRLLHGLSEVDAATTFTIGLAFLSQDVQHQDYAKAFRWLKKALEVEPALAPNNLNSARLELGKLYLHGNGTDCNLDVADDLFRQVSLVDLSSICTIGVAFCQDSGSQHYEKAFYWLTKAVQDEASLQQDQSNLVKLALGKLYLHGNGTNCDIVAADKLLREVTTAIDSQSCYTIGHAFYVPGEHQNYKKACQWFKKAAVDSQEAWRKLGILYIEGLGVNSNLKEGKAWLQKFANANDSITYRTSDRVTLTVPKEYIGMDADTVYTSVAVIRGVIYSSKFCCILTWQRN